MPPHHLLIAQRSRSRIPALRLHRPTTVSEAIEAHGQGTGDAAFMAGGTELVNHLKYGSSLRHLVHLGRVTEPSRLREDAGRLVMGAGLTHREAAESSHLRECFPALAHTCAALGNPRIRHKGSLGGNLMSCNPAYDIAPVLMALGATLRIVGSDYQERELPIAGASAANGLLTAIALPLEKPIQLRIDRSLRPVAGLAVGIESKNGFVVAVRVAISCAYNEPRVFSLGLSQPLRAAELALEAASMSEKFALGLPEPRDDWQASGSFRRRMIRVLLQRLLANQECAS